MYSAENQLFVPNKIDRYSFGDRTPGTVYGEDGSIEIFLQAEEPTDPRRAGELAAGAPGPLLPRDAPLLAAGAHPDRRLGAAGHHQTMNFTELLP